MRIAMVSIMFKATPPSGYGGIERVVFNLTEELIKKGHEVVLFGAPGSYCSGETIQVPGYDPLRAPSGGKNASLVSEENLYKEMCDYLDSHPVDMIHDWSFENLYVNRHPEKFPFLISTCIPPESGRKKTNLVASSNAHAELCGGETKYIYYGLNLDDYKHKAQKNDHFIHISKIARYKGQHLAILAALKAKSRLLIAGNIEDKIYHNLVVRPLAKVLSNVDYIGEIKDTNTYLSEARCLVQTPLWFDAFPLITLEASASGTPIIAFAEGGCPEQIENGVNGYLCRSASGLADAMANIDKIRPEVCRDYAETRFSVARMADQYLELYDRALCGEKWSS